MRIRYLPAGRQVENYLFSQRLLFFKYTFIDFIMIDIDSITSQVKHNCNISDAKFWGNYLPCGLLMRMRDLYRIEKGLKPWDVVGREEIGEWIENREALWEQLEGREYKSILIENVAYDPFDSEGINSVINRQGLLYGAGYGNMLKPMFLLANLYETSGIESYDIHIAGNELARDLSTSPAMIQGSSVVARRQTMTFFLWDKYEEMKAQKCEGTLYHAFSEYGIKKDTGAELSADQIEEKLASIATEELSTIIYHEFGEATERRVFGSWWKDLIMKLPYSRAELFLRALKDILSDTCSKGMLAHIIKNRKAGSLYFYAALLGGMRRVLFPEIITAAGEFVRSSDWDAIERVRIEGYNKAIGYVDKLREMVETGKADQETIEDLMPAIS